MENILQKLEADAAETAVITPLWQDKYLQYCSYNNVHEMAYFS